MKVILWAILLLFTKIFASDAYLWVNHLASLHFLLLEPFHQVCQGVHNAWPWKIKQTENKNEHKKAKEKWNERYLLRMWAILGRRGQALSPIYHFFRMLFLFTKQCNVQQMILGVSAQPRRCLQYDLNLDQFLDGGDVKERDVMSS